MKRAFDVIASGIALALFSPILAAVALAIAVEDGRPVLFRQERVGRRSEAFLIHKFRTMRTHHEGPNISAMGDKRVTRVGRYLRKYKLDELPQLVDVLRGDMSIVGPRPEVAEYVDQWPEGSRSKILSVRPGITDPASIEFRNEAELLASVDDPTIYYVDVLLPRKAELYLDYVQNRTFIGDIKLILRTLHAL